MAHRDIVVIGASAGGLEALRTLLGSIPEDFDAAIFIVLHTANHAGSFLPAILGRASKLPVIHPQDGERFSHGTIYIAPPGNHMIVENSIVRVLRGPRENLHCPAIDPLFRSAAVAYGPRVIGVILTGMLDDGTSGLMVVDANGGKCVVEDPRSALFSSMPKSALEQVQHAEVVPLAGIYATLARLVQEEVAYDADVSKEVSPESAKETRIAEADMSELSSEEHPGQPSPFACPDCGGVLWEIEQNGFLRFRCRVGHAFTAMHLAAEQRNAVEFALWAALRALEESGALYRRMALRARTSRYDLAADSYEERASGTECNSRVLRDFLLEVNKHDA